MYAFFSAAIEETKSHYMALFDHDAQIAPYAFPEVHRLEDELLQPDMDQSRGVVSLS